MRWLTVAILLAGCQGNYETKLDDLIGKSDDYVLSTLGEPYLGRYYEPQPGETESWYYLRDQVYKSNPNFVTTFSGNTAYTRMYGGGTTWSHCTTRVYIRDGIMIGYDLTGNDCIGPR